jgi:hypothetical protein
VLNGFNLKALQRLVIKKVEKEMNALKSQLMMNINYKYADVANLKMPMEIQADNVVRYVDIVICSAITKMLVLVTRTRKQDKNLVDCFMYSVYTLCHFI